MSEQRAISINTQEGQNSISFVLTGELNALIINTPRDIQILIESDLGYAIFHRNLLKAGTYYLPIRLKETESQIFQTTSLDNTGFTKFLLDEKVTVTVIGLANTQVDMLFRLE